MNRTALILSAVVVLAGCSSNPGPLFIEGAFLPDKLCTLSDKEQNARGYVDLTGWIDPKGSPQLLRIVKVGGWGQVVGVGQSSSNNQINTLEGVERRYYLDTVHLSYKTSKNSPFGTARKSATQCPPPTTGGEANFLECDVIPVLGTAKPGADLLLGMDMIGPKMTQLLIDQANSATTIDAFTLNVTVELTGREFTLDKSITTGPVVYPITIVKKNCSSNALTVIDECGALACP